MSLSPDILASLKSRFGELAQTEFRDQTRVVAPVEELSPVLEFLKEEHGFDLLVDITCVDYLNYRDARDRFGMVYLLTATDSGERITVRCFLNEPDLVVPTVVPLWPGANWMEREVWDMFGIVFEGHPDHRRILLPEEFVAHPLRKDYPLQGRGERHNFSALTRGEG